MANLAAIRLLNPCWISISALRQVELIDLL
jgi:hypothetical protein